MNFSPRNQMAARRAAQRKRPDRIISILLILSLLFGNLAGFPSAAAELTSYCGKEGHVHTEECYKVAVTTEPTETEGGEETTSETTEAMEETEAAQTVIISDTPVCGKEEHTHTLKCYSNPDADVETAANWEATLPETLTGTWADDLLATVRSQVGYKESVENFIVEADGETTSGYNRYGGWYSGYTQEENQPYLPWNITFLFFSIYYSNIDDFPLDETCPDWIDSLDHYGLYRAAGEYTPAEGDLVFVDTDGDGEADRAGIVSEVTEDELTAIEGDYEGAVAEVTYDLPQQTSEYETTESENTGISISQSSMMLLSDGTSEPEPTVLGFADMTTAQGDAVEENSNVSDLNGTTFTIYFAAPSSWTSYTVKANVCQSNNENKWQTVNMTNTGETYVYGGTTYYVYSASVTEVYGGFDTIQFQQYDGSTWKEQYVSNSSWVTKETIEGKIYVNGSGWQTYSSSGGGGTTGTIVDIETTTFEPAADVLYVDSTFYDYYTDYEYGSNGKNRDTNKTTFSVSHDTWITFGEFNKALSEYYKNYSVTIPLYVGHFQPDWSDSDGPWGYQYKDSNYHQNYYKLYGFMDGQAYGSNGNTDQKYFMSVNNSWMDSGTPTGGKTNYAAQGLIQSSLGSDGPLTKGAHVTLPFFNAAFINGTNYLNTKLGDVYENVSFPFTKVDTDNDGVAYWTFDSAQTTVEMKQDTVTGDYFLEDVGNQGWAMNVNSASEANGEDKVSTTYGFFPFNSGSTSCNANTYNYGFGCRLDIPFRLTKDGMVLNNSGSAIPITFEFSGDDDVWVFIDGQLVLDIGGSHGKVSGSLNFATWDATVSEVKENPGSSTSGTNVTSKFTLKGSNTDEHTLTMFYMERGMWESNMKITFNFPDENQLEVKKEVDTIDVNSLFKSSFENQDLFTFNIKTLATHFGTKKASASGEGQKTAINVDLSSCTLTSQSGITFDQTTKDNKSAIHWYTDIADANGEYRDRRYGQIDLGTAYSMSGYETLDLEFYYDYSDTPGLSYIFIQLLDGSGNVVTVEGSHYFYPGFANRTVGSVTMGNKQWISISLDLDDLLSSADASVRYIRLGYDYPRDVYFSNISFQPTQVVDSSTVGFVLPQYEIPDYGSATSGQLVIPVNAVYTSSDGDTYRIGSSGTFVLHDGESVTFSDQFRRGSYMYLEEQESYLYDTTWAMYEGTNEILVTTSTVTDSSTVSGGGKDMPGDDTRIVTDGRIEKIGLLTGETSGANKYQLTGNAASPSSGNTFVFRHYTDPDNTSVTTKLKVVYTNTIKTGTLTISKAQATSSQEALGTQPFTFYVVFHNVGGMSLESAPIVYGPFTLTKGQSKEITGIPLGTWYKIHEVKAKDSNKQDIILENVKYDLKDYGTGTMLPSSDTLTVDGTKYNTYSVEGLIPTTGGEKSKVSFTFNNSRKSVVDLTVKKVWDTGSDSETVTLPTSIYVQLQRRTDGANWTAVTDYTKVQLAPGYDELWTNYTYTFENLDKYVSNTDKTVYQYRVVELDSEGNVITSTNDEKGVLDIDGTKYEVTYGTVEKAKDGEGKEIDNQFTQTIINKLKPKAKVTVTKAWNVPTGVTKPESVIVQLQRRTGTNAFAKIDDSHNVTLSANNEWTHTFEGLDEMDSNNVAYDYRVVELNGETAIEANGTFNVDDIAYRVTYSGDGKATLVENTTNEYTQTITNSAVPEVTLQITKLDATNTSTKLKGVEFKLEKDGVSTEATTDENGIAKFEHLARGTYTLTETKAKSGYSLLKSSITIKITESVAVNGAISYTATVDGTDVANTEFTQTGNVYTLAKTIYNKQNLTMPATGGVNGFEFWILGGLCMMAVPLLLYTFFWFKKGGKYLRK